jgi:hypothetical protein
MKMTHTLTLNKEQLSAILIRLMKLPNATKVDYNLVTAGNQQGEYKTFGSVALSYETELENVPNFEGSPLSR